MADDLRMALAEVLRKAGVEEADFLCEGVRVLAQELMELELAEHVGAERHERTPERLSQRVPRAPVGYARRLHHRQRRTRGAGARCGTEREWCILAGVPARSGGARPQWCEAGDQRHACGTEGSDRRGSAGRQLAALPRALHA